MIIDKILDRMDNETECRDTYSASAFYYDILGYGSIGNDITMAMDYGENAAKSGHKPTAKERRVEL